MKFDIWTFIFQIINFMVLLFVLKRIFYKPVREIMEKRRAMAVQVMEDAAAARKEAQELQDRCAAELESQKEMRARMEETMKREVEQERQRLLEKAALEARQFMERENVLMQAEKIRFTAEARISAIDAAVLFARNICRDISSEELHRSFYQGFLGEVETVARSMAEVASDDEQFHMEVISAYPLEEEETENISRAIEAATGRKVSLNTATDREILAGVKIMAFDRVYDSSLLGQLEAYALKLKESA